MTLVWPFAKNDPGYFQRPQLEFGSQLPGCCLASVSGPIRFDGKHCLCFQCGQKFSLRTEENSFWRQRAGQNLSFRSSCESFNTALDDLFKQGFCSRAFLLVPTPSFTRSASPKLGVWLEHWLLFPE